MDNPHSSGTGLATSRSTVSAQQQGRLSGYLAPASSTEFRDQLTACLVLTAPVGMTEDAKAEWLAVAWQTLKHLPGDLLSAGCLHARKTADHPSKIVPAIVAYAEPRLASRKRTERECAPSDAPRLAAPSYVTPAEASEILKEFGLKTGAASTDGDG